MPNSTEDTHVLRNRPVKCARCGYECSSRDPHCPRCGGSLALAIGLDSYKTVRAEPLAAPAQAQGHFETHAQAILQCVPSGQCVSVALETPLVLGRQGSAGVEETLDLTDFDAYEQGVSRRHCLLQREDAHLTVIDLGSANGTFLNGKWLPPFQKNVVANGDHLVLGRLHLTVAFSSTQPD